MNQRTKRREKEEGDEGTRKEVVQTEERNGS